MKLPSFVTDLMNKSKASKSTIIVNGETFEGNNVSVINGEVIVDGKKVVFPDRKEVIITVTGDIGNLQAGRCRLEVGGSVGNVSVSQGAVVVEGDVKGEVNLSQGDLECTDIFADVRIDMGNVKASTIHGSVKTKMGNITR